MTPEEQSLAQAVEAQALAARARDDSRVAVVVLPDENRWGQILDYVRALGHAPLLLIADSSIDALWRSTLAWLAMADEVWIFMPSGVVDNLDVEIIMRVARECDLAVRVAHTPHVDVNDEEALFENARLQGLPFAAQLGGVESPV